MKLCRRICVVLKSYELMCGLRCRANCEEQFRTVLVISSQSNHINQGDNFESRILTVVSFMNEVEHEKYWRNENSCGGTMCVLYTQIHIAAPAEMILVVRSLTLLTGSNKIVSIPEVMGWCLLAINKSVLTRCISSQKSEFLAFETFDAKFVDKNIRPPHGPLSSSN